MTGQQRIAILGGIAGGVIVAAIFVWLLGGPSQATVRRTVVSTVQAETPASVLVTGRLDITATVDVDSTSPVTPGWLTSAVRVAQPELLPFTLGTASASVRVPGSVSYGFDVRELSPDMITLAGGDVVEVQLPALSVQSVEPDLTRMEVQTASSGWMKLFTGDMEASVRSQALRQVQGVFRTQAEARLNTTNQPGINTARALRSMLTPALVAAGMTDPRFRFRIREDLVLTLDAPSGDPGEPQERSKTSGDSTM